MNSGQTSLIEQSDFKQKPQVGKTQTQRLGAQPFPGDEDDAISKKTNSTNKHKDQSETSSQKRLGTGKLKVGPNDLLVLKEVSDDSKINALVNKPETEIFKNMKEFASLYQNQDLSLVMSKPGFVLMNATDDTVHLQRTKSEQERQRRRQQALRDNLNRLEESRKSDERDMQKLQMSSKRYQSRITHLNAAIEKEKLEEKLNIEQKQAADGKNIYEERTRDNYLILKSFDLGIQPHQSRFRSAMRGGSDMQKSIFKKKNRPALGSNSPRQQFNK